MRKFFGSGSTEVNQPPGSLEGFSGKGGYGETEIEIYEYNKNQYSKRGKEAFDGGEVSTGTDTVTWININGICDPEMLKEVGEKFALHPLTLEDIMNTRQRPKRESFDNYIFIVLNMLTEKNNEILTEQISLILGQDYVISFQEKEGDVFDPIRERIIKDKGQLRKKGADYLGYVLIDSIVDHYFYILESFEEEIESLDDEIIEEPRSESLTRIQDLKREIIFLRKTIVPLRQVINSLIRMNSPLINKKTIIYLRDIRDHVAQIIDEVEIVRDRLAMVLDIYLSSVSNRMNEVMKVLTIIATIFIPLTFIAGVYGMNFTYMPELALKGAYPAVMIVMGVIAVLMLLYFKWKKWL